MKTKAILASAICNVGVVANCKPHPVREPDTVCIRQDENLQEVRAGAVLVKLNQS
jgi:hypothetical protein